jgi:hypothetical protein
MAGVRGIRECGLLLRRRGAARRLPRLLPGLVIRYLKKFWPHVTRDRIGK